MGGVGVRILQDASSTQRLHAFAPHTTVLRGESHVAVIRLLAHRHFKADTEGADEVVVLVAIVGEGVYHPHLLRASVEVEADHKSPPPRSPRGGECC